MRRNANLNASPLYCCPPHLPNLIHPRDMMFTKETVVTESDDQRNRKMNEIGTELVKVACAYGKERRTFLY